MQSCPTKPSWHVPARWSQAGLSLPMGRRTIRTAVEAIQTRGLIHFRDLFQWLHIQCDSETRTVIRVQLAGFEIHKLRKVIDGPVPVVVLEKNGAGKRREAMHK